MTLEMWLSQATCGLSAASAAQVRSEIQQHYECAMESAPDEQRAVASLGDPKTANRQYRKVLITAAEASLLGSARWEIKAVCSRPWTRLFLLVPFANLYGAIRYFLNGETYMGWMLLTGAVAFGLYCAAPFLPIYTPARGRIFRAVRWTVFATLLALLSSGENMAWMFPVLIWPMMWIEWAQMSLRRKLPVAQWPKTLYI